jgi:hypothetical protein
MGKKKRSLSSVKKAIRGMRTSYRENEPDENGRISRSTHKMGWTGDINKKKGEYGVYPSIRPKDGVGDSSAPKDWQTQTPRQAKENGEFIDLNSKRRAEKLAAGSWKKGRDRRDAMKEYRKGKRGEQPEG